MKKTENKKVFWKKLTHSTNAQGHGEQGRTMKKPFFVLAPMADVTDCAFRKIIAKYGKPNVLWTEFVSADGLAHKEGRKKLLINLKFSKKEKPIVAQIFGSNPVNIKKAAALCRKLGFDGIDINMGCPDRSVEKQGSGAAMIKNLALAKEIIKAARAGAGSVPVSVKTRIGYNPPTPKGFGGASINRNYLLDEKWIKGLLEENLPALTVHLRTRKEMSNVPAHWELMPRIVELRNEISRETLIIGNGDVLNLEDAKQKVKDTGCDGAMLGRAIFGNPWLFKTFTSLDFFSLRTAKQNSSLEKIQGSLVSIQQKLKVLVEHTEAFEKMLGKYKSFAVMKKHFKAYVNGFEGAKELRVKLMEAENAKQIKNTIHAFLKEFSER